MSVATKYNPQISWRSLASNVFQLTRETVGAAATYQITTHVIDTNQPGAGQKEIGFCFVDYFGIPFSVIGTAAGSIDVQDDFRTGLCPTSGKMGVVYKSVYNGRAQYLSQDNFQFLHPLALGNSRRFDLAVTWANDPNAKKVPFTSLSTPIVETYQTDQTDPEDPTKTINYAEDFGETPLIRCIIVVDANTEYQLQQMPQFTKVDGLIDTAFFDISEQMTGYLIISKA